MLPVDKMYLNRGNIDPKHEEHKSLQMQVITSGGKNELVLINRGNQPRLPTWIPRHEYQFIYIIYIYYDVGGGKSKRKANGSKFLIYSLDRDVNNVVIGREWMG